MSAHVETFLFIFFGPPQIQFQNERLRNNDASSVVQVTRCIIITTLLRNGMDSSDDQKWIRKKKRFLSASSHSGLRLVLEKEAGGISV